MGRTVFFCFEDQTNQRRDSHCEMIDPEELRQTDHFFFHKEQNNTSPLLACLLVVIIFSRSSATLDWLGLQPGRPLFEA